MDLQAETQQQRRPRNKCDWFRTALLKFKGIFSSDPNSFDINNIVNSQSNAFEDDNIDPEDYIKAKLEKFLIENWEQSVWNVSRTVYLPEPHQIKLDKIYKNTNIQEILQIRSRKPIRKYKNTNNNNKSESDIQQSTSDLESEQQQQKSTTPLNIDEKKEFSMEDFLKSIEEEGENENTENFYQIKYFTKKMIETFVSKYQLSQIYKIVSEREDFNRIKNISKIITSYQQQEYSTFQQKETNDSYTEKYSQFFAELIGYFTEEGDNYEEIYNLKFEKGEASLHEYVNLLRDENTQWQDQNRHISYIFKSLLLLVFKLWDLGYIHYDICPQNLGLFSYEKSSLVKNQYRLKLQNFSQIYKKKTISEELNEEVQEILQKNGIKLSENKFTSEEQALSFMLYSVARTVMKIALGVFPDSYSKIKVDGITNQEILEIFQTRFKKQFDQKIVNLLGKLSNFDKIDPSSKIIEEIQSYEHKCPCEKINYSANGAQLLSCKCQIPTLILDNKGLIASKIKTQNNRLLKETENTIKGLHQTFNQAYNSGNIYICLEILNRLEKKSDFTSEVQIQLEGNCSKFLMDLAHFAAEQKKINFSKQCYETSIQLFNKEIGATNNANIYLRYLEQLTELITYYQYHLPETVQKKQYIKTMVDFALRTFSELYQDSKISPNNAVVLLYNIVENIPTERYESNIFIYSLIWKFEELLEDDYSAGCALHKIGLEYTKINYAKDQMKLVGFHEQSKEYFTKAIDKFKNVISSQDQDYNKNALEKLSETYSWLIEVYRKSNQIELCFPLAKKQIELVKSHPWLIFQIDTLIIFIATNTKKKNQTQEYSRKFLLEVQEAHEKRKQAGLVQKYVDSIYPLTRYLDLLIGTTYYNEENYELAATYYDKFYKLVVPERNIKYESLDSLKKSNSTLEWGSWVYYLKFMAETFVKQKQAEKGLQVHTFFIQSWYETKKKQPNSWVAFRYSTNHNVDYFQMSLEQEIYDFMNQITYSKEAKKPFNPRFIGESLNVIFRTLFQKSPKINDEAVKLVFKHYIDYLALFLEKNNAGLSFKSIKEAGEAYASLEKSDKRITKFDEKYYNLLKLYIFNEYPNLLNEVIAENGKLKLEEKVGEGEIGSSGNMDKGILQIQLLRKIAEQAYVQEKNWLKAHQIYLFIDYKNTFEDLQYENILFIQFKALDYYFKFYVQQYSNNKNSREICKDMLRKIVALQQKIPKGHILQTECTRLESAIKIEEQRLG